jgi:hypothetical protein
MTVAEFVEWLKSQDQNAVVHVVFHETGYGYDNQGGTAQTIVFDPFKHSTYVSQWVDQLTDNVKTYPSELLLGVYQG